MKKTNYLTYEGMALLLAGAAIACTTYLGLNASKNLTAVLFIFGGIFSYFFSQVNTENKIPSNNQLAQGLILTVFGCLFGFAKSQEEYVNYITFFVTLIAIFEITFGMFVLDTGLFQLKIYIERMIAGAIGIIAAAVVLSFERFNLDLRTIVTGIVIALFGLGIIRFSKRIKYAYK